MDSPGRAVSAVGNCLFLLILSFTGCARFHSLPISPEETAQSFESRSLTNADLQAFLAANHVDIHAKTQWDLNMLTLVAFYYQPDLAVARADFAIAQAARVTAGQRPNPSVSLAPEYDTTSPPPWIFGVNWDVPIETAGKRGHRLEQARLLSDAALTRFHCAA